MPSYGAGMSTDRAADFAALHDSETPLLLPNAWDYASGAALVAAGFAAIGTTSMGVAAAHGWADARGQGRDETVALAHRLVPLPCPVTVDIEAGFSTDAGEVADLAVELADSGVAGINIEDGRTGDTLADPHCQATLLATVKARAPRLFLNARIDTHWLTENPPPVAQTLARAKRYTEAGADGIFVPGLSADADIGALVTTTPAPINLLCSPRRTVDHLADLGVRRISTGSLLFRAALHAAVAAAEAVRDGQPIAEGVPGYTETQRLIGTEVR
jgi:2-methylisocitrate lyase-like PEP mutase family enzyme